MQLSVQASGLVRETSGRTASAARAGCPRRGPSKPVARLGWLLGAVLLACFCVVVKAATPSSPVGVTAAFELRGTQAVVRLSFAVPREHMLYAERLEFETEDGQVLLPSKMPDPVVVEDKVSGHEKRMYDRPFAVEVGLDSVPAILTVKFRCCSNSACYFPDKRSFSVTHTGVSEQFPSSMAQGSSTESRSADWRKAVGHFKVLARETGYMRPGDFHAFLDHALQQGDQPATTTGQAGLGLLATLTFILVGGLGLNLTPCVLPLIPINLAIIGAGARCSSRRRGFALGAAYGTGMALAYGVLGLFVVLTGSKFGALNSSVWFNAVIALSFVLLALGMFGFVTIDFSRFQGCGTRPNVKHKSQAVLAFGLGVMAALLAGACVAPVIISVLVLSTQLYSQGVMPGLLLPFLLGLGMALPWPLAGAGLSFLPKPGKWMVWTKYTFAVLILAFAAYYSHLAWHLFQIHHRTTELSAAPNASHSSTSNPNDVLLSGLDQARLENRPVFIDFAASWCKNCVAMDETVFNQEAVKERLKDFVVVRYDAEEPNVSPARELLDHFGVMGLPTYIVLRSVETSPTIR